MTPEDRVVAVLGVRQGSGVLLTPELILTSGHVVSPGTATEAIALGNREPTACTVVWSGAAEQCDAALLRAHRPLVDPDALPQLRWGVLSTREPVPGCQALGFPDVERSAADDLDIAQVPGTLLPGAARVRGRSVLRTDHHPPAPVRPGASPWSGLSGGPVYAGPLLVGVVAEDREGWQHSAIEAVPLFQILGKPGFTAALRKHWPDRPEAIPLHFPRVDDFAYEARYAAAVKARYSRLEVFGLDDLGEHEKRWDLDTAYLSLQAEAAPGRDRLPQEPRRVEDLLAMHPRAILRGEAGAGKTTLVWWLASHAACQTLPRKLAALNGLVPFVVPMRRLAALGITGPSPAQLPAIAIQEDGMPDGWAGRMLDSGRVLLLVDGLDELPRTDRAPARQWLDEFLRRYPQTRCLATVRPRAVEDGWLEWQGFEELRLLPMSDADIQEFVTAWHNAARLGRHGEERDRLDELERDLKLEFQRNKVLRDLARTPLLCAVICALHRRRSGLLPHTRWALYRAALAMLLGNRDVRRGIGKPEGIQLEAEDGQLLLQHIAIWLVRNGQTELTRKQAVRQIELAMRGMRQLRAHSPDDLMDHLLNRSGLLQERTADSIQFIHRTFQDFLAAKEFQDSDSLEELLSHAAEEQWRDVIRLVIGHCNRREAEKVIQNLIGAGDTATGRATRWALRTLAAECAQGAGTLDDSVYEEVWAGVRELGPPDTFQEVMTLSSLGREALTVIPGPDGLNNGATSAYAVVLGLLGPEAIPMLHRYGKAGSGEVRGHVVDAWGLMPAARYAEDVLARMRLDDVEVAVSSPKQGALLPALGPIGQFRFTGNLCEETLRSALRGRTVRKVSVVGNTGLTHLGFLDECPEIEEVSVTRCPALRDISALAGLPLKRLSLFGHGLSRTALGVLAGLPELARLQLDNPGDVGGRIPAPLPRVTFLHVRETVHDLWLDGIEAWTELRSLVVYDRLADPDDLGRLGGIPHFEHLILSDDALGDREPTVRLHRVRKATLRMEKAVLTVPLHELLPELEELTLHVATPSRMPVLDLDVLHRLPGLAVTVQTVNGTVGVRDADRFAGRLGFDVKRIW
ncbi:serine protease [Streptomyces sp. I05A-00742]|uniref:serine protease n=1 Tax=Streptomyces sp. I05A-00742 TaxID=2732853 RepID=UPI00148770BA|nr:serine protease [Streptomyces sp. I05A-00742]